MEEVEQGSNLVNPIRNQDIGNQNGTSTQMTTELVNDNHASLEKRLGLDRSIGDRMEVLTRQITVFIPRSTVYKLTMPRAWLISDRRWITN